MKEIVENNIFSDNFTTAQITGNTSKWNTSLSYANMHTDHEFMDIGPAEEDGGILNPMQIEVIVRKLFSFLNVKTINHCRYVCQTWNDVAEPLLRNRSKISFSQQNNKSPANFVETFSNCQTNASFTNFSFNNNDSSVSSWSITEISAFFEEQRSNIKELDFGKIILLNEDREKMDSYDLTNWISNLPLNKLCVHGHYKWLRKFTLLLIPLHQLPLLRILDLSYCAVIVEKENRISPVKISFEDILFYRDGNKLDHCCINDYINFEKAEIVSICGCKEKNANTIVLDLTELIQVKYLKLRRISAINWGTLKIKELDFGESSINLAALPSQIAKITFANSELSCNLSSCLPNLKQLNFIDFWDSSNLSYFTNCVNLVELDISCYSRFPYPTVQLDLNWIPRTVKSLTLDGSEEVIDGRLNLSKLVINKGSLSNATLILEKIEPQTLVLRFIRQFSVSRKGYTNFLIFLQKIINVHKFYVGPFNWSMEQYEKTGMTDIVNVQGDYYVFQDKKGKNIDMYQFNAMNFTFRGKI